MLRVGRIGHRIPTVVVAVLLVLAAGACSSGGSEDATTTTADPTHAGPPDTTPQVSGVLVELTIANKAVQGGVARHEVRLGETVVIHVTSDEAEELHVHGYDLMLELTPGRSAELTFDATIPGVFEVELEGSGLKVAELQVA